MAYTFERKWFYFFKVHVTCKYQVYANANMALYEL